MKHSYELVVIGGGPAGLAAALAAEKEGLEKILLLERDNYLGGILPQCIHNGFGLDYFKEELTGPEYAARFIERVKQSKIKVMKETLAVEINEEKAITALNSKEGIFTIKTKALVLAMGCRERSRGAIRIPGDRPAGILTAGTAQRYVNIEGYMPGREVVILGSGDIGMIMARRLTLEGAKVKTVLEILPYTTGLSRNRVQCLEDFNIPLRLGHTITRIKGQKRVESVIINKVDQNLRPIVGTEEEISCDTVLLSVGLIPENELSSEAGIVIDTLTGGPEVNEDRETSIPGIFACGNVLQVHDLVDYVTEEGNLAGRSAAIYLQGKRRKRSHPLVIKPGQNIGYVLPQRIVYQAEEGKSVRLFMRVKKPLEKVKLKIQDKAGKTLLARKREIVTPGEMESILLSKKLLEKSREVINISIEPVKAVQSSK